MHPVLIAALILLVVAWLVFVVVTGRQYAASRLVTRRDGSPVGMDQHRNARWIWLRLMQGRSRRVAPPASDARRRAELTAAVRLGPATTKTPGTVLQWGRR